MFFTTSVVESELEPFGAGLFGPFGTRAVLNFSSGSSRMKYFGQFLHFFINISASCTPIGKY